MKDKTYSIIIVTNSTSTNKEFVVSSKLIRNSLLAFTALMIIFAFMIFDYLTISFEKEKMRKLKSENVVLEKKNSRLFSEIEHLNDELNKIPEEPIEELNKAFINLKKHSESQNVELKKSIEKLDSIKSEIEKLEPVRNESKEKLEKIMKPIKVELEKTTKKQEENVNEIKKLIGEETKTDKIKIGVLCSIIGGSILMILGAIWGWIRIKRKKKQLSSNEIESPNKKKEKARARKY